MSTTIISAPAQKVNVSDIINNLTSTATDKPLSAAQGKILNDKITTRKQQTIGHDTATKQMNSDIMGCSLVTFVLRRYGYFDSFVLPMALVLAGVTTAGIHRIYNTNDILIKISNTGLITLTGNGTGELDIDLYEI